MSIQQRYFEELRKFEGAPYVWGGSSPSGSDCSGSVCSAVSRSLGIRLRVTADELYRRFFTENVKSFCGSNFLYAAFFLDERGRAVHVAGWCGACYVNVSRLESGGRGAFRSESEMKLMYSHLKMITRGRAV